LPDFTSISAQCPATQKNPLLAEIDTRIEEINNKIESARASNKKAVKLSVLTPALQYFSVNETIK
jgi:hypothetical protein